MADKPSSSKIPVRVEGSVKASFLKVKRRKSLIEDNEARLAILKKEKFDCSEKNKSSYGQEDDTQ